VDPATPRSVFPSSRGGPDDSGRPAGTALVPGGSSRLCRAGCRAGRPGHAHWRSPTALGLSRNRPGGDSPRASAPAPAERGVVGSLTLNRFVHEWWESKPRLAPTTQANYRDNLDKLGWTVRSTQRQHSRTGGRFERIRFKRGDRYGPCLPSRLAARRSTQVDRPPRRRSVHRFGQPDEINSVTNAAFTRQRDRAAFAPSDSASARTAPDVVLTEKRLTFPSERVRAIQHPSVHRGTVRRSV
jgi:hypothetical protein